MTVRATTELWDVSWIEPRVNLRLQARFLTAAFLTCACLALALPPLAGTPYREIWQEFATVPIHQQILLVLGLTWVLVIGFVIFTQAQHLRTRVGLHGETLVLRAATGRVWCGTPDHLLCLRSGGRLRALAGDGIVLLLTDRYGRPLYKPADQELLTARARLVSHKTWREHLRQHNPAAYYAEVLPRLYAFLFVVAGLFYALVERTLIGSAGN